jgi:hypothetical protein
MKVQVRAVQAGEWVRSSRCNTHNNCVELRLGQASVGVRDSKNAEAGSLAFGRDRWRDFLTQFVTLR